MTNMFLPSGDYTTPVVIENQDAAVIRGEGMGRTFLRIDGPWGVEMRGKVGSIEITDLTLVLNGKGSGIGCNSGAVVDRFRARRVEVMNGATGISMNADLGGSFKNSKVEDCHVHDMPGNLSGSGYGIHLANADGAVIARNLVERCGRHSIYQARTGKRTPAGIQIVNNTIRQHRIENNDGAIRCAIVVSRSSGVVVGFNQVLDGYGGGLEISQDGESVDRRWPCDSVDVMHNQFFGRLDAAPYVMIGEQQIPPQYVVEDVTLTDNRFDTLHTGVAHTPDIWVMNGRHVILRNIHRHRGADGFTQRAITIGDRRFGTTPAHLYNVDTKGSRFMYDNLLDARPLTLDGPARFTATSRISFEGAPYIEP